MITGDPDVSRTRGYNAALDDRPRRRDPNEDLLSTCAEREPPEPSTVFET
jgi:hypothetical protein